MAKSRSKHTKLTVTNQSDCESCKDYSRRDFLMYGGRVLAGTMSVMPAALAVNTAARKVRIGVVGGGFGAAFQRHEHPDCIVQAVGDLREERRRRLTKVYNCRRSYNSLEEQCWPGKGFLP